MVLHCRKRQSGGKVVYRNGEQDQQIRFGFWYRTGSGKSQIALGGLRDFDVLTFKHQDAKVTE